MTTTTTTTTNATKQQQQKYAGLVDGDFFLHLSSVAFLSPVCSAGLYDKFLRNDLRAEAGQHRSIVSEIDFWLLLLCVVDEPTAETNCDLHLVPGFDRWCSTKIHKKKPRRCVFFSRFISFRFDWNIWWFGRSHLRLTLPMSETNFVILQHNWTGGEMLSGSAYEHYTYYIHIHINIICRAKSIPTYI